MAAVTVLGKDPHVRRVTDDAKTRDESGGRNEAIARCRGIGWTNSDLDDLPLGGQSIGVREDSRIIESPRGHIGRCSAARPAAAAVTMRKTS
jgi:hypothetical protein